MVKGKYTYYILGIIIVVALLLKVSSLFNSQDGMKPNNSKDPFVLNGDKTPISTTTTPSTTATTSTSTPIINKDDKPFMSTQEVILESPQPGQVVTSPLIVTGQAKGNWFFEASLPVKLLDNKGQTIVIAPAQAQGEWMTEKLVPFKVTLDFKTEADSGYLVIAKDNPSGLPEHDASVRISVRFLNK